MAITAELVKQLRDKTGAGMMDCKAALTESGGDLEKAVEILRKKGMATAAKRAGRATKDGMIGHYIHMGGKVGVLVEVNCETDFVANTDAFKKFAKEVALHVANLNPQYVKREDVPAELVESERQVLLARTINEGKKPEVAEKVVAGRMDKFYQDIVLMEQPWLKDDNKTISQLLAETVAEVGESIEIRRFARFEISTPVDVPE